MGESIIRPVGSRFKYNGVELEVVDNSYTPIGYCDGCYFDSDGSCDAENFLNVVGCCSSYSRIDRKDVIFKEVKES